VLFPFRALAPRPIQPPGGVGTIWYTTGWEVYRPPGSWGCPHYSSLIPGLARDAAPLIPGLARDAGSGNEHSSLIPGLARDAGISKEGINVLSVNTLL
jgi:hypothetical protein